jgi:hypothetical protein
MSDGEENMTRKKETKQKKKNLGKKITRKIFLCTTSEKGRFDKKITKYTIKR